MSEQVNEDQDDAGEILDAHQPDEFVTINDNGKVLKCVVRELGDGDELASYMNWMSRQMRRGSARDFTGMHAELISRCLYDRETGAKVPKAMIQRWGAKLQSTLFTKCQDVCGLSDKVEAREGKD